jgi:hypothetical protein
MKRFLVFALVLMLAGASAFAVDLGNGLTATGEVKTGVKVGTTDDGDDDTTDTKVEGRNEDAGQAFRTRLTLAYTGDWGGAKIRFQGLGFTGDTSAYFSTKYAYGWANLLDSKIVLYGGGIGDDLWGLGKLGANVFDDSIDAISGVRAEFKVVDGLSFGLGWPVIGAATAIDHAIENWVFGGLYKSPLVSVAATVAVKPGTDKTETADVYGWKDNDNDSSTPPGWDRTADATSTPAFDPWIDAIAGIEVNPIDVLKVVVDTRFDSRKLYDSDGNQLQAKNGYFRVAPLVQFSSGPLTAHARGDIVLQNDGLGSGKGQEVPLGTDFSKGTWKDIADLHAKWVPVEKLGDTSIAFRVGAAYNLTSTINAYAQVGSDNVSYLDGNGLYVKPGIKFTLGSSSIEIFDKINGLGAKEIPAAGALKARSPIVNQFQIDLNWSF